MITIQHNETGKNGIFEAWMKATEEGACTEPVQVGEMTYSRPTPAPTNTKTSWRKWTNTSICNKMLLEV